MSYAFDSRLGEQLYRLLPEVYRTRDKKAGQAVEASGTEDLAKYLDAHGHLLDLIHATLKQQLDDALPESSQDWLLPYFAQLLAANIVSPDSEGKHAEISHAVSWRQRKGTLKCAEEIAEAVGQMEVEIQEGWKRVAMTPRIGMPIIPPEAWDNTLKINWDDTLKVHMKFPSEAARHPGLPAAMVDLRWPSRAVEARPTNPATQVSSFAGIKRTWRQMNHHGVPCFPGSFEDVSRRTVDFRTADSKNGHYHHKRLLAYASPPVGIFALDPIQLKWSEREESRYEYLIEEKEENGVWVIRNLTDRIIEITDEVTLSPAKPYRLESLNFKTKLSVDNGGSLELYRVEAVEVQVDKFSTDDPVLIAEECLFNELIVEAGTAKLDSCTILEKANLKGVDAVNCIFNVFKYNGDILITGEVRYSRIPSSLEDHIQDKKKLKKCTINPPEFLSNSISYSVYTDTRDNNGAGVLHPDCDASVYAGANDGREMGYFHQGRRNRHVHITAADDGNGNHIISLSLPDDGGYPLEDIIFEDDVTVTKGRLVLKRSAAPALDVAMPLNDSGEAVPSLSATDCLFKNIDVANGLTRLEYCTVMELTKCKHLQASDCIFVGTISGAKKQAASSTVNNFLNCLRFCSIPSGFLEGIKAKAESHEDKKLARALQLIDREGNLTLRTNTFESPVFDAFYYCKDQIGSEPIESRKAVYDEYGYGVLSFYSPDAVRFGAEDGGEMGAYHHRYYALKAEAMLDKMREFLPVGIEPVIIYDTRLLQVLPENKNLSNGGTS